MSTILALSLVWGAQAAPWELIDDADGVQTHRRWVGEGALEFRGRGVVGADLWRTVAVLMDESTASRWVYHCAEARVLRRLGPLKFVTYRRNIAGVPLVADRDMVLDVELQPALDQQRMTLVFSRRPQDPLAPPRAGVIRVPAIRGSFQCDTIDAHHTQVVYQVAVDTGGSLPAWLVRRASAELPRRTLTGLAQEVSLPDYDAAAAGLAAHLAGGGRPSARE